MDIFVLEKNLILIKIWAPRKTMVSVVSTLDFQNLYSYLDIHRPNYTTNAKKIQIHYI